MESLILTLDGAIDPHDWTVSGHAMRWMPPEQAAEIDAPRRPLIDELTEAEPHFGDDRGYALLGL